MNVYANCKRRRGCEVNDPLPHDRLVKPFSVEVHGKGNDTQKVLSLAGVPLDKVAKKIRS
jgi:hypothetical protein